MGSEMCIRDRLETAGHGQEVLAQRPPGKAVPEQDAVEVRVTLDCLLYTSDAADERSSVDLGGRRIIKKKNKSK